MSERTRIDKQLRNMLTHHQNMLRHLNGAKRAWRLFRRSAYRFAVQVMELQEKTHNEFLEFVAGTNMSMQQWLDEHFAIIEQSPNGESRTELFAAIREGMTEREYVDKGMLWNAKAQSKSEAGATPGSGEAVADRSVLDNATPEEKISFLESAYESHRSQLRDLRRTVRDLQRNLARVLSENERYKKENDLLRKDAARADAILVKRIKATKAA